MSLDEIVIAGSTIVVIGAVLWAGVERNLRKDAEKALVDQQMKVVTDANAEWARVAKARNEFDEAVRDGLGKMRVLQDSLAQGSSEFRKLVDADPGSRTLLSPAELAALRVLAARRAGQQANGGTVRPAQPSP